MSGFNYNDYERRLMKLYRRRGLTNTDEESFGGSFQQVEHEYYAMYFDYFYNLLINLITYDNLPDRIDGPYLEFCLRTYGFARIGGANRKELRVLTQSSSSAATSPTLGMFGFLVDGKNGTIHDDLYPEDKNKVLRIIDPFTLPERRKEKKGYVNITNKYAYYYTTLTSNFNDFNLIDRVAKTLAKIKATANMQVTHMKIPFMIFSKNKNLTGQNVYDQFRRGNYLIKLDDSIGEISDVIQPFTPNIQDWLPSLKAEWNNNISEMLTMLGINNVGVDKKERLITPEANSNSQLVEASGNIYITARQKQLDLLNKVFKTNIIAKFNQESYNNLVQLADNVNNSLNNFDNGVKNDSSKNDLESGKEYN